MCTLTIYSSKKRCVVTMNRDEQLGRAESGVLHSTTRGGIRLFHPVDLSAGGTWFGVNSRGVILALLNRYRSPHQQGRLSRGKIIPEALAQGGFDDVRAWLSGRHYGDYNPFDLYLIAKKRQLQFSWDGNTLTRPALAFKRWYMVCSAAIQDEEVRAFRRQVFRGWSEEMGDKLNDADEILRGYHLIQMPGMEARSVLMERPEAHTKSVIQADINGSQINLKYIPLVLEQPVDSPMQNAQIETFSLQG